MSHVPNELSELFPDKTALIRDLNGTDAHFAGLTESYHELNRAVHRAETDCEPTDDAHMTEMRRKRLRLLDEISACIRARA
ncbi:YdcH family protein [Pontivivens ytuae]|uniref:DUF465 domain-containing protein n=1 Tax=Pontivivens ytuae TaxID=2789856 RepID=A0A7S9QD25_9RHOB|nr:DUF465 domain-containing protein [Pontivivens ytuae]QPH54548.1 DUF465 domain-containing protein [Pontivivens ytuae]